MTRLPLPCGLRAELETLDGTATIRVYQGRRLCETKRIAWTVSAVRASTDSQLRHLAELARQRGIGPREDR